MGDVSVEMRNEPDAGPQAELPTVKEDFQIAVRARDESAKL